MVTFGILLVAVLLLGPNLVASEACGLNTAIPHGELGDCVSYDETFSGG
jgi:hypothetical protein